MKKLIGLMLAVFCLSTTAYADNHTSAVDKGTLGLSFATFMNGNTLGSSQLGDTHGHSNSISLSGFISDHQRIGGELYLNLDKKDSTDLDLALGLGVDYRHYLNQGKARAFAFGHVRAANIQKNETADHLTLHLDGGFGGEVWLTNNFTMSGSVGAGLNFSDKFKTIGFTTVASSLQANIYF